MVQGKAHFCPKCSSSAVNVPALVGQNADCTSCNWKGPSSELLVHEFEHDLGSDKEMLAAFMTDFKNLMAMVVGAPLAKILMKWGFFEKQFPTPPELARYVRAMAEASVMALLKERHVMEKERALRGN